MSERAGVAVAPAPPPRVAAAIDAWPPRVRRTARSLRALVFEVAADRGVGPLTETLKWGEPAYLTEATGAGTTVRLGWSPRTPPLCRLLVSCNTTLVDAFRARFPDTLGFEGNRAVLIDAQKPLATEPLAVCIGLALTYHRDKRARHG